MYESACAQSGCPESSARYCWSLVQRKISESVLNVNEHWPLEFLADITELVMSASFSLVF